MLAYEEAYQLRAIIENRGAYAAGWELFGKLPYIPLWMQNGHLLVHENLLFFWVVEGIEVFERVRGVIWQIQRSSWVEDLGWQCAQKDKQVTKCYIVKIVRENIDSSLLMGEK